MPSFGLPREFEIADSFEVSPASRDAATANNSVDNGRPFINRFNGCPVYMDLKDLNVPFGWQKKSQSTKILVNENRSSPWEELSQQSVNHFRRSNGVLAKKLETWSLVVYKTDARPVVNSSVGEPFSQQEKMFEKIRCRVGEIRNVRQVMRDEELKKQEEQNQKNAPLIAKSVLETKNPVASATSSKQSTSVDRYDAISLIAKPVIADALSIESSHDSEIRDIKLKLRIAINKKAVQIANSASQISNIVNELGILFGKSVRIRGQPLLHYCFYILAKKIIDQAETQVSLHAPSSFPIAQVAIDLSVQHLPFVHVLLYLLMERCPYAIPKYVPQDASQSNEQYKAAQGYLVGENGAIESESAYTERMSGILSLLGAIMQARPTLGTINPYGIENAWLWLATMLNIKPQPITPFMMCSFLESAGYALWVQYGDHFLKILRFLNDKYLAMIPAGSVSAKTRLEIYSSQVFSRHPPSVHIPEGSQISP